MFHPTFAEQHVAQRLAERRSAAADVPDAPARQAKRAKRAKQAKQAAPDGGVGTPAVA